MGLVARIVVGPVAGALGKLLMPGDDPRGIVATILIGMAGDFLVDGFVDGFVDL